MTRQSALALLLAATTGCATFQTVPRVPVDPPPVPREFRGLWVASVNNIDWPSRRGLPAAQQQAEILAILDRAAEINANAVILQLRPSADALYRSDLEPWSTHLTGQMGIPPDREYDPLAFAIEEAHRRGLELHACSIPTAPASVRTRDRRTPLTSACADRISCGDTGRSSGWTGVSRKCYERVTGRDCEPGHEQHKHRCGHSDARSGRSHGDGTERGNDAEAAHARNARSLRGQRQTFRRRCHLPEDDAASGDGTSGRAKPACAPGRKR